ncbi:MAG: hypothetical protein ACQR33_02740 [Candidatus Saccharibacteria bacterium]
MSELTSKEARRILETFAPLMALQTSMPAPLLVAELVDGTAVIVGCGLPSELPGGLALSNVDATVGLADGAWLEDPDTACVVGLAVMVELELFGPQATRPMDRASAAAAVLTNRIRTSSASSQQKITGW